MTIRLLMRHLCGLLRTRAYLRSYVTKHVTNTIGINVAIGLDPSACVSVAANATAGNLAHRLHGGFLYRVDQRLISCQRPQARRRLSSNRFATW